MLTGITALTMRARYYSFYVWTIKNVNETEKINRLSDFENAFFDRERAYAMACIAHNEKSSNPNEDHSNIQGLREAHGKWQESGTTLRLHGFRHLGNRLGGYGYYYQASVGNLGLTQQEHIKDVLTPLGVRLAEAFEKKVSKTKYFEKFIGKNLIPKSVFHDYGSKACLCLLHGEDASDRDVLREILLGTNEEAKGVAHHKNRQDTLVLVLHVIDKLGKLLKTADEQTFLNIAYFRQFLLKEKAIDYSCPSKLNQALDRWKLFRGHDYFSFTCESLFHIFLESLDINRNKGLSFTQFTSLFDTPEFVQEIASVLRTQIHAKSPKKIILNEILANIVKIDTGSFSELNLETSYEFDQACNLDSTINEQILVDKLIEEFESEELNLEKSVILASLVLLLIFARFYWRSKPAEASWKWLVSQSIDRSKNKSDLGVSIFVYELERRLSNPEYSLYDFVCWIYEDYIITQAITVYNEKVGASLYNRPISWFHSDGKVYRIDRGYDPRFRNSRFYSCISILNDLGLCTLNEDYYVLTNDGKTMLHRLASGEE